MDFAKILCCIAIACCDIGVIAAILGRRRR